MPSESQGGCLIGAVYISDFKNDCMSIVLKSCGSLAKLRQVLTTLEAKENEELWHLSFEHVVKHWSQRVPQVKHVINRGVFQNVVIHCGMFQLNAPSNVCFQTRYSV